MKKLIIIGILLFSSLAYGYCNYYNYVSEYTPSYVNYKVCVYRGLSGDLRLRYPRFTLCPVSIRYDEYNGWVCR